MGTTSSYPLVFPFSPQGSLDLVPNHSNSRVVISFVFPIRPQNKLPIFTLKAWKSPQGLAPDVDNSSSTGASVARIGSISATFCRVFGVFPKRELKTWGYHGLPTDIRMYPLFWGFIPVRIPRGCLRVFLQGFIGLVGFSPNPQPL